MIRSIRFSVFSDAAEMDEDRITFSSGIALYSLSARINPMPLRFCTCSLFPSHSNSLHFRFLPLRLFQRFMCRDRLSTSFLRNADQQNSLFPPEGYTTGTIKLPMIVVPRPRSFYPDFFFFPMCNPANLPRPCRTIWVGDRLMPITPSSV